MIDTTPEALRLKLKDLPKAPGVYLHRNKAGEVIYVGKAAVLYNRVRQYFQGFERKDPKTKALVEEIYDTDWIVVDTEMDALFLESELIKRYMPKWNILLRDDKATSYIRLSMNLDVPDLTMTRNPEDDGAVYFGPYYGKVAITRALRVLRKVFPFYDKPYHGRKTLDTDLGLTPGIEVGRTSTKDYRKDLKKLMQYLRGERKKLEKDLAKEMKVAAVAGHFEEAAKARDQLFKLKALATKIVFSDKEFLDISSDQALIELQELLGLARPPVRIEGYDISHQGGENVVGSMVCFTNGVADRKNYRRFKLKKQQNNDTASLREVIKRRLKYLDDWGKPEVILLDGGIAQFLAVQDLTKAENISLLARDKSGDHSQNAAVKIVTPKVVALPQDGHLAKLIARIDGESHRFAVQYHRILKQKSMLGGK